MLQNEYLVAKIGVDPAENEPRMSDVSWPATQRSAVLGTAFSARLRAAGPGFHGVEREVRAGFGN